MIEMTSYAKAVVANAAKYQEQFGPGADERKIDTLAEDLSFEPIKLDNSNSPTTRLQHVRNFNLKFFGDWSPEKPHRRDLTVLGDKVVPYEKQ